MQAELGKPSLLQPDKGKVSIYIDCSSTAEPAFEVAYSITFLASLFFFFFFFFFFFQIFLSLFFLFFQKPKK